MMSGCSEGVRATCAGLNSSEEGRARWRGKLWVKKSSLDFSMTFTILGRHMINNLGFPYRKHNLPVPFQKPTLVSLICKRCSLYRLPAVKAVFIDLILENSPVSTGGQDLSADGASTVI